jgi:hypothetical protein
MSINLSFRLGLGPTYHMNENIINNDSEFWTKIGLEENPKTRQEMLKKFFDDSKYKSSVDFPANVFFEDLMQIYPNAKIILSVRDSPESWAKSAQETIFGYESGARMSFGRLPGVNQLLRPVPFVGTYQLTRMIEILVPRMFVKNKPSFSLPALSAAYSDWKKHCKSKVSKEKLLIFNVKEGWKPLCDFLEVKKPDSEFPRVNDKKSYNGWYIISREIKSIFAFFCFYFLAAFVLYFFIK